MKKRGAVRPSSAIQQGPTPSRNVTSSQPAPHHRARPLSSVPPSAQCQSCGSSNAYLVTFFLKFIVLSLYLSRSRLAACCAAMSSFNDTPLGAAPGTMREQQQQQQWPSASSGLVLTMDTAISPCSEVSPHNSYGLPISPDSSNDSRHGSSPEADAAETSARPLKSGRTPSRYDWSKHKPTIKRLYIDEDKTLKEMLEIMQRDHNFVAT